MFRTRVNSELPSIRTDVQRVVSPPSPTGSATTQASGLNITGGPEIIITRAHLRTSVQAFEELLRTSTLYRNALSTLSDASAQFAEAIETCSRLRGTTDDSKSGFQAAGGLFHVIGNHEQVLSDTIRSQFDKPLRAHLQTYRSKIAERSAAYEQSLLERNRVIRQTEKENMNVSRRKQRDLESFRAALQVLQEQVNQLDVLKADYYREVLAHEEETWDAVLGKVSLVVRSSLDVYDRISTKSSDPTLEPLLQSIPDPFNTYGPLKAEDQIFSIVPTGILENRSSSPTPTAFPASNPTTPGIHELNGHVGPILDGVKTWMDGLSNFTGGNIINSLSPLMSPRSDSLSSIASPDWSNTADWTDSDRARRHSLPSLSLSSSSSSSSPFPITASTSPSVSTQTASSSSHVPFPITERRRTESKLRHVLSVIGEGEIGADGQTVVAKGEPLFEKDGDASEVGDGGQTETESESAGNNESQASPREGVGERMNDDECGKPST